MKIGKLLMLLLVLIAFQCKSQDTFSILAFDSITGEIGAAGASCLDLGLLPGYSNDFLAEIFPDTGAIVTQAQYYPANQQNARIRMRAGYSATQLIAWLQANDAQSNPAIRQYGVIRKRTGSSSVPPAAAFTGSSCMSYANHIVGPNYSIQGNILLGKKVLDSMEARFNRETGDLACKLMAAMQGAKMVGADTRCTQNNTSSLFAFLKVSLPTDTFGKPLLLLSLRTSDGSGKEPIDSLQKLFNSQRLCMPATSGLTKKTPAASLAIFPNPFVSGVYMQAFEGESARYWIYDLSGRQVEGGEFRSTVQLDFQLPAKGMYIAELRCRGEVVRAKVILE